MTCRVPANQMIYQALLNKAASYPADKNYQAAAYRNAAESVSNWLYDLRNDYVLAVPGVGTSIAKFITDFNNHPCSISFCSTCEAAAPLMPKEPIKRQTAEGSPLVKLPANQRIYQALLDKITAEPPMPTSLSEAIMASKKPLTVKEIVQLIKEKVVPAAETTTNTKPATPTCIVPHNQPIYQLLMNKAEHEKQKAADYKATAEALLTWDDNLVVRYYEMRDDVISFILDEYPLDGCSSEIASFIEQQLDLLTSNTVCTRCTPKGSEPRCYCDNPPY